MPDSTETSRKANDNFGQFNYEHTTHYTGGGLSALVPDDKSSDRDKNQTVK